MLAALRTSVSQGELQNPVAHRGLIKMAFASSDLPEGLIEIRLAEIGSVPVSPSSVEEPAQARVRK
jgi:hypothetical protein